MTKHSAAPADEPEDGTSAHHVRSNLARGGVIDARDLAAHSVTHSHLSQGTVTGGDLTLGAINVGTLTTRPQA